MHVYINLMKLTDEGIKAEERTPRKIREAFKDLEGMGGKLAALYTVIGEYDYVSVIEAPTENVALKFIIGLGAGGIVRTKTLKAITSEDVGDMVMRMP